MSRGALVDEDAEGQEESFLSFVQTVFNESWYLANNPGLDLPPLVHWLEHGVWEYRQPSPYVLLHHRAENGMLAGWRRFIWKSKPVHLLELDPRDHHAFISFVRESFDPVWYLAANPDVARSGMDPLTHWLVHGFRERRQPSAYVLVDTRQEDGEREGWQHFKWSGESVRLRKLGGDDAEGLLSFARELFDPDWYLAVNPELARSGLDALVHWIEHGIREHRLLAPGAIVRPANRGSSDADGWRHFDWQGGRIKIKHKPVPVAILEQVVDQAELEPTVLAAGSLTLQSLPVFDALDELPRAGLNVHALTTYPQGKPKTVLLIPHLMVGGADKYVLDLIAVLRRSGNGPFLIIVTETSEANTLDWRHNDAFQIYKDGHLIFWPDICGPAYKDTGYLAFLMNYLRPATIIVSNSHRGLEMISRYGRGLSSFARLVTTYFSLGFPGLGVTWGTRYARRTAPFALAITDNSPTERRLLEWCGAIEGPGVRVIPSRACVAGDSRFQARLTRRRSAARRGGTGKWLWISRLERFKGTKILAELAKLRPADRFFLFGPLQEPLGDQGLEQSNVLYGGLLASVVDADFDSYDGFLFTSLFEGLPLIVLEMSQHAIPMVVADVGGLRDTFDDSSTIFVPQHDTPETAAQAFSSALDKVMAMDTDALTDMVVRARLHVIKRHSQAAHEGATREVFCDGFGSN